MEIALAIAVAFFIGVFVNRDWNRPEATLRVKQGQRPDGREGRWRWRLFDATNRCIAASPVAGWETCEEAVTGGRRACRYYILRIVIE